MNIHQKEFELFIESAAIEKETDRIAAELNRDYKNKKPLFIAILNGSFMFASDIMKKLDMECEISFVKLRSYVGLRSSGVISKTFDIETSLEGKDVIILEDIVDTGTTMQMYMEDIASHEPASVKIVTLLFKPEALQQPLKPDYTGFEIRNVFVVGYGLDYDGLGRNLKDIYKLKI